MYRSETHLRGDFDGDFDTDGLDLAVFASAYINGNALVDLDDDGDMDTNDLALFAANFGKTNQTP